MWKTIFGIAFDKIEDKKDAIEIIKAASYMQFFAAGMMLLLSLALSNPYGLLDVIFYTILGFSLLKSRSRIIAIILLIYSVLNLLVTLGNSFSDTPSGGTNYTLSLLFVGLSFRAVQATFKLHSIVENETMTKIRNSQRKNYKS